VIKLVCFLRRKPGMPLGEFYEHWRDRHGPLIAGTPELARHLRRYEQNHRLASDRERDAEGSPGFDGATIQWLDSMDSFLAFVREPKYAELIAPDEKRFLDRSSLLVFFTEQEEVKIDGDSEAATVKLLALLRRKPGIEALDFHAHWRGPHAELFSGIPEIRRHILAYHQNHRVDAEVPRGPLDYDGLAEQWYTSPEEFAAMGREPRYRECVPADEDHFVDRAAIEWILCAPPHLILG